MELFEPNRSLERNKGMARKRYFPLSFSKQEKPYVSLALIANQAFNIFFRSFISGDQPVFDIKKRPAINPDFNKKSEIYRRPHR